MPSITIPIPSENCHSVESVDSPRSERNIILLGDHAIHSFNGAIKHYSPPPSK
jgi:hypothetical protein